MKLHTILALLATLALPLCASADAASEASKPELVVLNWADYIDPDLIAAFEARHHAKVRVVKFEVDDNRDQLLLATAGAGYDIVLVNETHVAVYRTPWHRPPCPATWHRRV